MLGLTSVSGLRDAAQQRIKEPGFQFLLAEEDLLELDKNKTVSLRESVVAPNGRSANSSAWSAATACAHFAVHRRWPVSTR